MDNAMLAPFSRYTDQQMASIRLMRSLFCWLKDHPNYGAFDWPFFKKLADAKLPCPTCYNFRTCGSCPLGYLGRGCADGHWDVYFNATYGDAVRVIHSTWIYNRLDAAYRHEVTLRRAERRKA